MKKPKPFATITLDLDNQWSYMKIHGDKGWEDYPSYLDLCLPKILDVLDDVDLKITFFIVGQDAAFKVNRPVLQHIVERGHEVGNHSFHHETWLKQYSRKQIENEIDQAEQAILQATGMKPGGFRGPGFSWSPDLIEVLHQRGYLFDSSSLPTYIGPVARLYYFWKSKFNREERKHRHELFGSFKDGLRPVKPYFWNLSKSNSTLLEIPITTIPVFKFPFHLSYLIYISSFSIMLTRVYLNLAIFICRLTRTSPCFLLHPLDFISDAQIPQLAFFPAMHIKTEKKIALFKYAIAALRRHYNPVTIGTYAKYLKENESGLRHVKLG